MQATAKRGRPSKGLRLPLQTRVDPETHRKASREATKADLTVSEWLANVVKEKLQ